MTSPQRVMAVVSVLATLQAPGGKPGASSPGQDLGRAAAEVRQQAATDVTRLENDLAGRESTWRTMFVGELKRGDVVLREDEVFDALRHAQRLLDDLRRELRGMDTSRPDAAVEFDRSADIAARATLGRWQLAKDEATLAVDLARQRYETAGASARRQRDRPGQREAATRLERDARVAATRSVGVARDRLQRARDAALASLGALKERARTAGRTETANAVIGLIDAELNVTAADASAISTALDRFLENLTVVFESAGIDDRAETLTLAGAFSPVDVERLGVAPVARAIAFTRMVPNGFAFERASSIAFGRAVRVQVEFDAPPGAGTEPVLLEWGSGAQAGRLTVPVRSGSGTLQVSELIEVWPAGRFNVTRSSSPATTAPAGGRGIGGIDLGGSAAAPAPAPIGQQPLDGRIAALRRDVDRLTRESAVVVEAIRRPGEVRDRAGALRERAEHLRRTFSLPAPQPDSAADKALNTLRTRWDDLAEPIWAGQPPAQPLAGERFAELAARFGRPPCQGLRARPGPVGMVGDFWACVSDAFFADLVAAEGEVERITAEVRQRAMAGLDRALSDVDDGLQPQNAPDPTEIARGVWLRDMTKRLLVAELEAARLQLTDLERRQTLAADPASSYGWFLKWSARTESADAWRWAPHVARVAPGSTIRATYGGVTVEIAVDAAWPSDAGAFFARALYAAHDQARRLTTDSARAIERELRDYASMLERGYASAGATQYENDEMARLRRAAVDAHRQQLQAAAAERLATAGDRVQRARDEAIAAIGGAR